MLNDFYSFFRTNHEWVEYKKQVGRFYLYDYFNFPMKTVAYEVLEKDAMSLASHMNQAP